MSEHAERAGRPYRSGAPPPWPNGAEVTAGVPSWLGERSDQETR